MRFLHGYIKWNVCLFINLQSLPHGSKILCGDDVYGGTYRLLNTIYNDRFEIKHINTADIESVKIGQLANQI